MKTESNIIEVHISTLRAGDTIIHNEEEKTICNKDLSYDLSMGCLVFGDSYKLGTKPVRKVEL